jgi:hypothetical protein
MNSTEHFHRKKFKWLKSIGKKWSPSRAMQEMETKTTLKFHLTSVTIATIKNTTNNKHW